MAAVNVQSLAAAAGDEAAVGAVGAEADQLSLSLMPTMTAPVMAIAIMTKTKTRLH